MAKVFYFDVETSGTDVRRNAIIQIGAIIEIDGRVVEEYETGIRPHEGKEIVDEALAVSGTTREDLETFPKPGEIHRTITELLSRYADPYKRNKTEADKFTPAGFNVSRFDFPFLIQWFMDCGDKYFGSFFNWKPIDPLPVLHFADFMGLIKLPDYKLGTVCEYFGVKLDNAHDAMADIRATRSVILKILERLESTVYLDPTTIPVDAAIEKVRSLYRNPQMDAFSNHLGAENG